MVINNEKNTIFQNEKGRILACYNFSFSFGSHSEATKGFSQPQVIHTIIFPIVSS